MDPLALLGLPPTATPREIAAAYRRLAKAWHPDRGGGPAAERRMAEINAAYDLLRGASTTDTPAGAAMDAQPGAWLPPAVRRAMGDELLRALEPDEDIWLVTPTTTWASPQALLAASGERLVWLLDDAISGRVQSLSFATVDAVEHALRRPRRRVATLRIRTLSGRRLAFGELRPAIAEQLSQRIAAGSAT